MAIGSFGLTDNLTIEDFDDVRRHFNLPDIALVEKDLYVVKALAAITTADTAPFRLVFGGGTSLSRAHGASRSRTVVRRIETIPP